MNLEALRAEEILRDRPGLTADQVKALTLAATGSQEAAEDAWCRHLDAEMRAGIMR